MSEDHYLNLQPGTVVNGRYEIVKCLGAGSMGMVYACRHRELSGHLVAMKVLFSEVARDTTAAARFRNEIVASYGVSNPNVVRAYEYFRDGDLIAFTMEYISGGDLADRISVDNPMPIDEIVRMLSQMCGGVQAIHSAGIIHRDLKPENILLTAQGDVKITDFGIARTTTGPKLTEHGGVVGTIDYVSPEYLERGQVDARSDIYAVGVLAYEMVTGESPFKGKSVIETMTMRLRTDPTPPHQIRPDCPVALSNVILKAMARDVEKRYQTAADMLRDLQAMSAGAQPAVLAPQAEQQVEAVAGSAGAISAPTTAPVQARGNSSVRLEPVRRPGQVKSIPGGQASPAERSRSAVRKAAPMLHEVERLESVLNPESGRGGSSPNAERASPSKISVSESHLSAERLKKLSAQVSPQQESMLKGAFWVVLIILIGFVVGLSYLHYAWQDESQSPLGTNETLDFPAGQ